ncbi:sensor histidine kinase [Bacillus sp. FJAT-49711]|uniref:sensor histidine kinase n=1 Tax=Bacillus sp. FJAT-49711 TaxID=2833585 RepID=UPI001BC91468|nr:sensor histidine kinase [Bacillus sp. FJAT-49711]MBS4218551.1 sensor histidine kinase [Bacillus sp. FJAT-49711]
MGPSIKVSGEQRATGVSTLNGEWEFYWEKLYTPIDFEKNNGLIVPKKVNVPQTWSQYEIGGKKLPKVGYATYRLVIDLPLEEAGSIKALLIPGLSSAHTLWINDEVKWKSGKVGKSKDSSKPGNSLKIVQFQSESNQVEIVIQVSNFQQRKAGITEAILIGDPEEVYQYHEKKLLTRAIIVISLIVMGFYHITLFANRRKERSQIFFGLVCIFVAMRSALLEAGLVTYIYSVLSWEAASKLEYLGASLGVLFFTLFTYTQYAKDMNQKYRNIIIMTMGLYSVFVMVTPVIIFTNTMLFFQILIILSFLYLLFVYIKAFIHRREGSIGNILAISFLFFTVINDILFYNNVVKTTELASVGLFFYLFTQSVIISKKFSLSFIRIEKLSEELTRLNTTLEQQVHNRTIALQLTNKELHETNEKLNEAHQSRSRWIHNISHEIATPLTSIRAYTKAILDGIIESDKKYIQLLYDQSLYISRMLNDLRDMTEIENKEIKFNMERVNIKEFCIHIFEKYKWDIEKQGILFTYEDFLPGPVFSIIDSMRMEQVIVNLLTNAQRFVDHGGSITLEVSKENEKNVKIAIRDNGSGINEKDIKVIFERFYRGSDQGKSHSGSGLGLAISKEIIHYHNGMIAVESEEGKGSYFYIMLPII